MKYLTLLSTTAVAATSGLIFGIFPTFIVRNTDYFSFRITK